MLSSRGTLLMMLLIAGSALASDTVPGGDIASGSGAAAQPRPLLLTFVGDIMHHDLNARMSDYDRIYDAVRPYLLADSLSFANIEFPVDAGREPSGYPLFNGTDRYVEAAIRGGFDVFSLANNHSFDWGTRGAVATARYFSSLSAETGTHHNGLRNASASPITPTVIIHDGWRIAFVSITTFSNVSGSSQFINLVDLSDASVVTAFLADISSWDSEYDLLIVSAHAGTEYTIRPDADKAQFFRKLIAHGADIVWGHHPHVLQPWEIVNAGIGKKLILHSTGNFISAQRRFQQPFLPLGRWAPTGDTALFRVTVVGATAEDGSGPIQPSVVQVSTPIFTVHNFPSIGLVPVTFGALLSQRLPVAWWAFYAARYASTRSLLNAPLASLTVRKVNEPQQ